MKKEPAVTDYLFNIFLKLGGKVTDSIDALHFKQK